MASSFSRRRIVRDWQEALDPDYPAELTKQMLLEFIRTRGHRSFWEVGNRLRRDLIYWMATHRSVFMTWRSEIDELRPGYFRSLPAPTSRFTSEYDLSVRLDILPSQDPVQLDPRPPPPVVDAVKVLDEMCQKALNHSRALLDTLSSQQQIIEGLRAHLTLHLPRKTAQ